MRQAQPLGEDHAGLRGPLIVGLQAGQYQIAMLVAKGVGQRRGHGKGISADRRQPLVFHMNRAVGPARQRFAEHLSRSSGSGRADHDFPAMLLAQPQRLLERVRVGLVHLEAGVLFANRPSALVDARLPLARGHLFEADSNLHFCIVDFLIAD